MSVSSPSNLRSKNDALDGLSFVPPDGWNDQVVRIYAPSRPGPGAVSLAVTQWPRGAVQSFDAFILRQLTNFAQRLPQFDLLANDECVVGERRAVKVHFQAVRGDRARLLHELIAYVDAPDENVVTVSCTFPSGGVTNAIETMDRLLSTVRFESLVCARARVRDEDSDVLPTSVSSASSVPPPSAPSLRDVPMPGQRRFR